MKKSPKLGFSLIELSIVILIIGILVVGITKGSRIVSEARLKSARALTASSPVASTDHLVMWLETTLEKSFTDSERVDTPLNSTGTITNWYDINPQTTSQNNATQEGASNLRPRYVANGINGLPALNFDGSNDYFDFDGTSLVNNDFTIFMVWKTSTDGNVTLFGGPSSSAFLYYLSSNRFYPSVWTSAGQQSTSVLFSKRKVATLTSMTFSTTSGIKFYAYGGGISASASDTNDIVPLESFNGATIAKTNHGISYFAGNIGEFIIFNKRLSDTERVAVEGYLKTKWEVK